MKNAKQVAYDLFAKELIESDGRLFEALEKGDKERIERIVRRELKSKESNELFLKNVKSALTQLFKTFYTRRTFWRDLITLNKD